MQPAGCRRYNTVALQCTAFSPELVQEAWPLRGPPDDVIRLRCSVPHLAAAYPRVLARTVQEAWPLRGPPDCSVGSNSPNTAATGSRLGTGRRVPSLSRHRCVGGPFEITSRSRRRRTASHPPTRSSIRPASWRLGDVWVRGVWVGEPGRSRKVTAELTHTASAASSGR